MIFHEWFFAVNAWIGIHFFLWSYNSSWFWKHLWWCLKWFWSFQSIRWNVFKSWWFGKSTWRSWQWIGHWPPKLITLDFSNHFTTNEVCWLVGNLFYICVCMLLKWRKIFCFLFMFVFLLTWWLLLFLVLCMHSKSSADDLVPWDLEFFKGWNEYLDDTQSRVETRVKFLQSWKCVWGIHGIPC